MPEPRFEGKDTPKICLGLGDGSGGLASSGPPDAGMKRIKQLGVDYVLGGGPRIPWEESRIREQMDRLKASGITLGNLMIGGFDNAIYNRPGRDEDIEKVIQSIRVAGKAGLPVVEYNWYAHRAMEGYFEETGRAGAGWTGFDYERPVDENGKKTPFKDLPPRPDVGAHTLDEMWTNIAYFLKAVVPEAEKAGVRLALHPNDPPAPSAAARNKSWPRLRAGRSLSISSRARRMASHSIVASQKRWARTQSKSAAILPRAIASITFTSVT
jgi:mannonate dehydratase